MWASAQAADTQTAWQQVNAWRRTHDLLIHHAGRLKACADELSYAWPPGRSPAAQAFVAYITELRAAIEKASIDAATNYTAIAGVLTSLSAAKADMSRLMQAWDSYENAPTAEKARRSSAGSPDSPEALNAQARARMSENDQEVMESSRRFVELTSGWREGVWKPVPLDSGSPGGTSSQSSQGSRTLEGPRVLAPSVNPAHAIDGNFDLAGSLDVPKPAGVADGPTPGLIPGVATPGSPASPPGVGVVGMIPPARVPPAGGLGGAIRADGIHAGQTAASSGRPPTSPLAVGAGRGQNRANPVGGVIEPTRTPSTPMLPFVGGGRGAAESVRGASTAPTMHWDVPEGVSPVIEPPPEEPFELGPGVIGIDR